MPQRIIDGFPAVAIDRAWIDCWDGTWRIKVEAVYGFAVLESRREDQWGTERISSRIVPISETDRNGEWGYESPLGDSKDYCPLGLFRHGEPIPREFIEHAEYFVAKREEAATDA
jgi:hypothetical protein